MIIRPGLTSSQKAVFELFRTEAAAGRLSPTYNEICSKMGWASKSNVSRVIDILVGKGYLFRGRFGARSLAVVPEADTYSIRLDASLRRRVLRLAEMRGLSAESVIVDTLAAHLS